ncbi:hypothetical protein [Planomicrobium okeanokoites]|uniref:hypothetical protein n=1 Tax=Planomicrobium okeanokoites TaxID=244 RepID=UPI002493AEED|nr:hypothetical protein [Planomicrobium okeanokoites]
MYKRREKFSWLFLLFTLAAAAGFVAIQPPATERERWELLFFLFPIGFVLSIMFISHQQYNKVKDIDIPESQKQLLELKEIVVKKDVALLPRLFLFEKSGEFIGEVKPVDLSWWMRTLLSTHSMFLTLLPMTYCFFAHNGERLVTFQKKGWLKQVELTIFDAQQRKIGTYIQEELKALIHIRGELFNAQGELILPIKASGFSGNFSWNDEQERQWAYFYNGIFPHEYTDLFQDSHNHIVKLTDEIPEEEKACLLAVIGYLFMMRVKN